MRLQITVLREAFAAYLTREWFFTCMSTLVNLQSPRSRILLSADIAFVGFLASVNEDVRLQVAFGNEALSTPFKCALKGPVSSMGSHMLRQGIRVCESFVA